MVEAITINPVPDVVALFNVAVVDLPVLHEELVNDPLAKLQLPKSTYHQSPIPLIHEC